MKVETSDNLRTTDAVTSGKGQSNLVLLHSGGGLYLGLDIGSTSSDIVVLDQGGRILVCDYRRTKGRPIETATAQLREILKQVNPPDIMLSAITGSAGRLVANLLDIPFINEIPAQAAAVYSLYPHLHQATIIEMGGQDSKLIFLSAEYGRGAVSDFAINAVCAAGTGSFLDQQAQRLGVDIENQFGQLALQSRATPRMAGRCSVFAKSDMIHLQQQATPTCDIIAGLCLALVRNLKSDLGCGREFVKPIVFTGGVAANVGVVKALEQVFKLTDGELIVPKEHFFTGAIGAVLVAKGRADGKGRIRLEKIEQYLEQRSSILKKAPRREPLGEPSAPPPNGVVCEKLLSDADGLIDAYLGVDVGSISTKAVVVDEQKRVLAKVYLMTAGQPLEAVRQCLDVVGHKVAGKVRILAAATTGSGRYLTGDFIGADVVVNEITAQAAGAAIVDPKVDTIFEIGGQDSKYISLENGVVVDFEMNHVCAAGTGSFLEEQAQRLGINIKDEFSALALSSNAPIKLGERCTVFMESDLLSYQQQDVQTGDLVAGLSYAIVTNYLNRVVGRRKIGSRISFQGGTAFNKAVWSAFEKVTGKPVLVPDHHEVTGALGAAVIAAEYMKNVCSQEEQCRSKFRGFENLVSLKYNVESFTCEHCPNHCDIKKVQIPGAGPLCYGSRCDRYNLESRTAGAKSFDAFEYRGQKLLEFAGLTDEEKDPPVQKTRIGIPGRLFYWQLLPLFARFFGALGFEVVLSGRTDKRIIRMGTESVTAQPCFPVKVAHGHVAELLDKDIDYIFLPSIVSMMSDAPCDGHNQLCPYVQSFPYQVRAAFAGRLGRTKLLTVPVRLGEGQRLLQESFLAIGRELGVSGVKIRRAVEEGLSAQAGFEQALRIKGREILSTLVPGRKLFVLVSRPYNGCDEGLNLRLPRKLAELDAQVIPMDMLDLDTASPGDPARSGPYGNVYWTHGWKILRAAEIIKKDPRLFAIYLSNFSCGPDSFLMTFFKDIMAPKPCLQIEIDEHSADAGLITRLEAFLDSLRHYHGQRPADEKLPVKKPTPPPAGDRRRLYVPYMSDCAYGLAACFKAYGQPAEVMPIADEQTLLQGRVFTTGKECLPCAITAGDMLSVIKNAGPDNAAFFMPGGCGPCRFGMYNCMHRLILRYAGAADVPVISPNQDTEFYKELADSAGAFSTMSVLRDMWTAAVGIDLLQKLLLRVRPFAGDARKAQQVYERALAQWTSAVEKRWSLSRLRRLMDGIAGEFADVELDSGLRKPRIGVVGEIYVRSHPFANMNIIDRLEELGAACNLAPLAEWVYYTNFTRSKKATRRRLWRTLFANVVQNYMQHRIEKTLAVPLEAKFGRLAEEPIEHTIELARPYLHHSFEGEAILSIGKMVEYYHRGFGGVVNVMPFTCMPSTIVSSQTRRISADCGGMPILNLSFDGQENATLTTRLEAFVEQVRHRQGAVVSPAEVLSPP